jgi:predicted dehydrogenase
MRSVSRREFLEDSAIAAMLAGAGFLGNKLQAADEPKVVKVGDANDRIRIACIGVHGQGRGHVGNYSSNHAKFNCEVAVICDVDEAVVGTPMKTAEQNQGKAPKYVKDLRKVMEDKSIDAVSIATPNHWHALAAIWAMQAGKDVYVEKPVSHNVSEGRRMVEAARAYKRICQTGTQSRSNTGMREAIAYVHSGKLGKLKVSRGLCYKSRPSIGKVSGPQEPPKTMDYDLWCGPAPNKPPMRNHPRNGTVHYDWHWIWDYGNGDLGNQGIHEMDKARWGLQKKTMPLSVVSIGGRLGYVDDGETPNTQICVFDYGDAQLIFEVRGLKTDPFRKAGVGNIFHCENGIVVCPNYHSGIVFDNDGKELARFNGQANHFENFLKAVRSRKETDLNADILEGHLSSALCHLGNISYRLGEPQESIKDSVFYNNIEGAEALSRMEKHLKDNKVELDKTQLRVGRKLKINNETESFVNDKEADKLLTREYRKGFEVPSKILAKS